MNVIKFHTEKSYCNPCDNHGLSEHTRHLQPDEIIMQICKYFNVSVGKIIGNKRTQPLPLIRHIISDVLHSDQFLGMSMTIIGKKLGGRDHTTILHGIRQIRDRCEIDLDFRNKYKELYIYIYATDKYFRYSDSYYEYVKKNQVKKARFHMEFEYIK